MVFSICKWRKNNNFSMCDTALSHWNFIDFNCIVNICERITLLFMEIKSFVHVCSCLILRLSWLTYLPLLNFLLFLQTYPYISVFVSMIVLFLLDMNEAGDKLPLFSAPICPDLTNLKCSEEQWLAEFSHQSSEQMSRLTIMIKKLRRIMSLAT